jgi:hypothetical protein
MSALRKILIEEEPVVASEMLPARAAKLYVVPSKPAEEAVEAGLGSGLKNIALFFAAPFIGLAYIIALPFVGFGYLAVLAARAAARYPAVRAAGVVAKSVGMFAAAPVIGLAYFVLFPVIGLGALLWVGGRAVVGAR